MERMPCRLSFYYPIGTSIQQWRCWDNMIYSNRSTCEHFNVGYDSDFASNAVRLNAGTDQFPILMSDKILQGLLMNSSQ